MYESPAVDTARTGINPVPTGDHLQGFTPNLLEGFHYQRHPPIRFDGVDVVGIPSIALRFFDIRKMLITSHPLLCAIT